MVRNGYVIQLPKDMSLNEYIDKLRIELKEQNLYTSKKLIAKDVEKLWDSKFINICEYESSILDLAIKMVNDRFIAILNGVFSDGRYDLRSTMNIVEINDDIFYCLFTTNNEALKKYFEELPEVNSYKYYHDSDILEDITPEENNERGLYWQSKYESCNWNTTLLGLSAQITTQPDLLSVSISPDDIKEFYRDKEDRKKEFIESRIVIEKVSQLIGSVPIEKIAPAMLEEFFKEGYVYLKSQDGQKRYRILESEIGAGFLPIDSSTITLV